MVRPETVDFKKYNFTRVKDGGSLKGGVCLKCGVFRSNCTESRLENHLLYCSMDELENEDSNTVSSPAHLPVVDISPSSSLRTPTGKRKRPLSSSSSSGSLKMFFDTCTDKQSSIINNKLLRWMIATGIDPKTVDHETFTDLLSTLRPNFGKNFAGSQDLFLLIPSLFETQMELNKRKIGRFSTLEVRVDEELQVCLMTAKGCFVQQIACESKVVSMEIIQKAVGKLK